MNRVYRFLGMTGLLVLLPNLSAVQDSDIYIEGVVTDSSNKSIEGVEVVAWRDGRDFPARMKTDAKGHYEIRLAPGRPVNSIEFSHGDYQPGSVLEQLSGEQTPHTINKVLFHQKERLTSAYQVNDVLQGYETLAFEAYHSEPPSRTRALNVLGAAKLKFNLFVEEMPLRDSDRSIEIKLTAVKAMINLPELNQPPK